MTLNILIKLLYTNHYHLEKNFADFENFKSDPILIQICSKFDPTLITENKITQNV